MLHYKVLYVGMVHNTLYLCYYDNIVTFKMYNSYCYNDNRCYLRSDLHNLCVNCIRPNGH